MTRQIRKVDPGLIMILVYVAAVLLLLLSLGGCSVERKIHKAQKVAYQYPDSFARFCGMAYPVKDSISDPVIKYVKADNKDFTNKIDSLNKKVSDLEAAGERDTTGAIKPYLNMISSLRRQISDLKSNYKPCAPDTLYVNTTHYKENTAKLVDANNKITAWRDSNNKLKYELAAAKKSASNRGWILMGIVVLVVVGTAAKVGKWFPFL